MENVKPLNKGFSQKDIKEIIERINKNLEQIRNDFSVLVSLIITKEEKKKFEGYKSFEFLEPLQKNKGFERFLMEIVKRETEKHNIDCIINKNKNGEIIQLFLKGDQEHINHILNACNWINKKIAEKQKQENKNIPKELL
jgi:acylphosphatase